MHCSPLHTLLVLLLVSVSGIGCLRAFPKLSHTGMLASSLRSRADFVLKNAERRNLANQTSAGIADGIPSVAEFALNKTERKKFLLQAEAGSADAAYKLALYYNMLRLDYSQGEHWMMKAASLGHSEAKQSLDEIDDRGRRFTSENFEELN